MSTKYAFALFLALFWGLLWAAFLQFTTPGRYLVKRRTWITVVIGVGVDLLILLMVLPINTVATIALIIAVSAVPIIARSIINEYSDFRAINHLNGRDHDDHKN